MHIQYISQMFSKQHNKLQPTFAHDDQRPFSRGQQIYGPPDVGRPGTHGRGRGTAGNVANISLQNLHTRGTWRGRDAKTCVTNLFYITSYNSFAPSPRCTVEKLGNSFEYFVGSCLCFK